MSLFSLLFKQQRTYKEKQARKKDVKRAKRKARSIALYRTSPVKHVANQFYLDTRRALFLSSPPSAATNDPGRWQQRPLTSLAALNTNSLVFLFLFKTFL